jgi:hypothetical protein
VGQPQRARHRLGHRGQHLVALPRRLEPVAEPPQRRGRVVAVAVDELVDGELHEPVQRRERDGHQRGGDDRAQQRHGGDVNARARDGQRRVDERAVDDEIDVPQAAAQDGDGDRGGERDHRDGRDDVAVLASERRADQHHHARRAAEGHPLELRLLDAGRAPQPPD